MKDKWVIFDMDNTLIETDVLYKNASDEFAQMMGRIGFNPSEVSQVQDSIDIALFDKYGYSTERFAQSFEDTVNHFMTGYTIDEIKNVVKDARAIAKNVFEKTSIEYSYAQDVVRQFANAGYKVGVITAGERWVQIKRFDNLSMRNLFHDCWVVLRKTSEVFEDFCIKHNVDKENSWMIGDNIKSDIISSTDAGLNAVHLATCNWSNSNLSVPDGVATVENLSLTPDIILGVKN